MATAQVTKAESPTRNKGTRKAAGGNRSVVRYLISHHNQAKGEKQFSPARLVELVREGLPVTEIDHLTTALDVSLARIGDLFDISKATLTRRRRAGQSLEPGESDRVVRFARLFGKAAAVLDSEEGARAWLKSPQRGLGGEVPLDFARTEIGAREVEDLLGRIEHGVYS